MSIDRANPKSQSHVKSRGLTPEEKARLGECPAYFNGKWLGRDPEGDEVIDLCYAENDYQLYHDWPYRVEGVVFHNRTDAMEFAWLLSRNQGNRDVWVQSPTGFPDPTNWWSQERMERDGDWTEEGRWLMQAVLDGRTHDNPDVPSINTGKIDEPSRAEAQGRRRAYYDFKLKKTIVTDEWEESPHSPNRQQQINKQT